MVRPDQPKSNPGGAHRNGQPRVAADRRAAAPARGPARAVRRAAGVSVGPAVDPRLLGLLPDYTSHNRRRRGWLSLRPACPERSTP
jgi:hypothetical protein